MNICAGESRPPGSAWIRKLIYGSNLFFWGVVLNCIAYNFSLWPLIFWATPNLILFFGVWCLTAPPPEDHSKLPARSIRLAVRIFACLGVAHGGWVVAWQQLGRQVPFPVISETLGGAIFIALVASLGVFWLQLATCVGHFRLGRTALLASGFFVAIQIFYPLVAIVQLMMHGKDSSVQARMAWGDEFYLIGFGVDLSIYIRTVFSVTAAGGSFFIVLLVVSFVHELKKLAASV